MFKKVLIACMLFSMCIFIGIGCADTEEVVPDPIVVVDTVIGPNSYVAGKYTEEEVMPLFTSIDKIDATAYKSADVKYGDINKDKSIDIADLTEVIFIVRTIPVADKDNWKADINGDCDINWDDVHYFVDYLFQGGPVPAKPCKK